MNPQTKMKLIADIKIYTPVIQTLLLGLAIALLAWVLLQDADRPTRGELWEVAVAAGHADVEYGDGTARYRWLPPVSYYKSKLTQYEDASALREGYVAVLEARVEKLEREKEILIDKAVDREKYIQEFIDTLKIVEPDGEAGALPEVRTPDPHTSVEADINTAEREETHDEPEKKKQGIFSKISGIFKKKPKPEGDAPRARGGRTFRDSRNR